MLKRGKAFCLTAVILIMVLILSCFSFISFAEDSNDKLDLRNRVYALSEGWESAANVVDDDLSTQYHSKYWWGALYFDLGVTHHLRQMKVSFPKDYLQTNAGLTVYVERIVSLNGTMYSDYFEVPDNSAEIETFAELYYTAHYTAENGTTVTIPLDAETRLLRLRIMTDKNLKSGSEQLNAKCTDVSLYGSMTDDPASSLLKEVYVDGKSYIGFDYNQLEYKVPVAEDSHTAPELTCKSIGSKAKVTVHNVTGDCIGKTAIVQVISENGMSTTEYRFTFLPERQVSQGKYALSYVHAWEEVSGALDGDKTTQWKAFDSWGCLFIDLGAEYDLSRFSIRFGEGGLGQWSYKIDAISEMPSAATNSTNTVDNASYLDGTYLVSELFNGTTVTGSADDEGTFSGSGRYIRLYVFGNSSYSASSDTMCVVKEFEIFAFEPQFEAKLRSITVDGKPLNGFHSEKFNYVTDGSGKIGTVDAQPTTSGATYTVTQCTEKNGKAVITVTSADKTATNTYQVIFAENGKNAEVISFKKKCIGYRGAETGTYPGYVVDEDTSTRYTGTTKSGGVAIDLKGYYRVTAITIDFTEGNEKDYDFYMDALSAMPKYTNNFFTDISDQNVTDHICNTNSWDNTKGHREGDHVYFVCDTQTRYLRLIVRKASQNVSIDGITVYGYSISGNDTSLSDLTVNGKTIDGFNPSVKNYYVLSDTADIPTIGATASDHFAAIRITQADTQNPTARVLVTSSDNTSRYSYYVNFLTKQPEEKLISDSIVPKSNGSIASGKLSDITDNSDVTACTVNPGKGQAVSLIFDCKQPYRFKRLLMMMGNAKITDVFEYVVDLSYDGKTYRRVLSSDSCDNYGASIYADLNATGRYLKITFFGLTGSKYPEIGIKDCKIYGETYESLITGISIGDKDIADFGEEEHAYSASYNAVVGIPKVSVKTEAGVSVEIKQAAKEGENAVITLTKGAHSEQYTVYLFPIPASKQGEAAYHSYKEFIEYR